MKIRGKQIRWRWGERQMEERLVVAVAVLMSPLLLLLILKIVLFLSRAES